MSALAEIVARAEELVRDTTFGIARRGKAETGGLAVGYMPVYVPRELLHSLGVLPIAVFGGGEDLEIIRGDAFYQSYICHIPRSTIELGLTGRLDALDGMIFPAICDVIRNLSGIWKLRFPDKLACYLDVPQNFAPGLGGRFYRHELEDLARELHARGARAYDPAALSASIALYNRERRAVAELSDLRRREPWKVPASEAYLVLRASLLLPVEEATAMIRTYCGLARAEVSRSARDQARVVVVGSFCEQPPLGLVRTLEKSGCYIVDDDFVQIHRWIAGGVREDGDPLDALVAAFLGDTIDVPVRYAGDTVKGAELVRRVRAAGAQGVLFCAPSFCDPALLDQPMAVAAMEAAGIPWTSFKYAENNGQFQVIREQAGTFADSIQLWSQA